ncbi:MAG TPA: prepilin peptidase [Candidatus Saccharimonadaceae bacterium]|nr:prepilin peptidase [Candidatus Saccharimonadaceae bacterium]
MDVASIAVALFIVGLIFGSFAGAQVWRLRARRLDRAKAAGAAYDKREYKRLAPLMHRTMRDDRSRCLSCGHELAARDLLPLVSWLSTGGRCRYCHTRIGVFEPLMELGMAVAMVLVYVFWPYPLTTPASIVELILWLVALVPLGILFAYDLKWFQLPESLTAPLIVLGVIVAVLHITLAPNHGAALLSTLGGVAILSGVYFVLWLVSRGRWIGDGDIVLGLGLALLLSDWELSFIALFAANFLGCLIVIPGLARRKISRTTEVQFGPLLIAGAIIALLAGHSILHWYGGLL